MLELVLIRTRTVRQYLSGAKQSEYIGCDVNSSPELKSTEKRPPRLHADAQLQLLLSSNPENDWAQQALQLPAAGAMSSAGDHGGKGASQSVSFYIVEKLVCLNHASVRAKASVVQSSLPFHGIASPENVGR